MSLRNSMREICFSLTSSVTLGSPARARPMHTLRPGAFSCSSILALSAPTSARRRSTSSRNSVALVVAATPPPLV